MKELTLQEVLQIAGGIPPAAALDELSYGPNECPVADLSSAVSNGQPPTGGVP